MKILWVNPKTLMALIFFMAFTLRLLVSSAGLALVAQDPPPPRAVQDALFARLAIDLARERDPAPISLDADGSGRHGVIYDRFTLAHADRAGRAREERAGRSRHAARLAGLRHAGRRRGALRVRVASGAAD